MITGGIGERSSSDRVLPAEGKSTARIGIDGKGGLPFWFVIKGYIVYKRLHPEHRPVAPKGEGFSPFGVNSNANASRQNAAYYHRTERHILSQRCIESPLLCSAQPAAGGHTLQAINR